jgi:predicted TPR repeat methyltransferase
LPDRPRTLIAKDAVQALLDEAREAARKHPRDADAALRHGQALHAAGQLPDAIGEVLRALRLDYTSAEARLALGRLWLEAGEPDKALEALSHLEEDDEVRPYILRAHDMKAQPRSDAHYVRHLFDQFSADYDERMIGTLGYQAPRVLRMLADLVMPVRRNLDILDLGCGTGLSGAAFKDMGARIDGVDLSPQMIEKARARMIYDRLDVADIETCLLEDGRHYDLAIAADTLVYLGDLAAVFRGAARRLRGGGYFLFTLERKDGDGFELGPKRRWRHSEPYVRELAKACELEMAGLIACVLRCEAGAPVEGIAAALRLRD